MSFRPALIVVDFQEDFCPPNGALAVEGGRDIAPIVNLLLAQPAFVLKVATQDWHPASHVSFAANHVGKRAFVDTVRIRNPAGADDAAATSSTTAATDEARLWPVHCVQGTAGAALAAELDTTHVQQTVRKGADARVEMYSPFRDPFGGNDTGLAGALRAAGATAVYVVGLAADYCVARCAADAAREGFAAYIVDEATRPVDPAAWPRVRRDLEERDGVAVVNLADPVVQRLITTPSADSQEGETTNPPLPAEDASPPGIPKADPGTRGGMGSAAGRTGPPAAGAQTRPHALA